MDRQSRWSHLSLRRREIRHRGLKEDDHNNPEAVRRFVEEAEVSSSDEYLAAVGL